MANVLGELFSKIAEAIRGGLGDIGLMKPTEFPDRIDEIVDLIGTGGGSGGGGSLPAGVYWEYGTIAPPNHYYQYWFWFNGVLYAITNTSVNPGNTVNAYKFSDGKWTQIISAQNISAFATPMSWRFVEFNGKIHMAGNEQTYHWVFDGTTFTQKGNIPNRISANGLFVQDSKLKAYSFYDGNVYVWDESTDTWTSEATPGSKYAYYYFLTSGGDVYAFKSTSLYKYENGVMINLATLSVSSESRISYNSCLYYYRSWSSMANGQFRSEWYKYNPTTGEETLLGYGPFGDSNNSLALIDGQLHFLFGNPSAKTNVGIMHEVTE